MPATCALSTSDTGAAPKLDLCILGTLLALANLPLLAGGVPTQLVLFPDRVAAGEWWRLLTHPFVHVSIYHLVLDGLAFLWLFGEIGEGNPWRRLTYLAGAAAGGAAAAWLGSSQLRELGLCGLSGVDHGLMAVLGLEVWRRDNSRLGAVIFGAVLLKALAEVSLGQALFAGLHLGNVGVPLVSCHLGGVLGATAAFAAGSLTRRAARVIRRRR